MMEEERDNGEVVQDVEEGDKVKTAKEMHVFPITSATIFF